ncbi:ANKL1 protein, partial [Anseranas semipalmata]|nr:ANKL1 protein [Anseranas semipalmata]
AAEELMPLHIAASRGRCRCLEVLLKKGGDPELRDQDGKRAIDLALQRGDCLHVLRVPPRVWGWPPAEALRGPRRSLSFLTEDCTEADGSDTGPLSSTRLSQLDEPELGSGHGLGEPPAWLGCPQSASIPSLALWPPGGSVCPPQPLASSTLLWAGDEPGEGPLRGTGTWVLLGPRDRGHPQDSPSHPQGSPSSSPTVLLDPGDHGHPQDSPSDPQGSPSSSSTVLLGPRDRGHPQDSPSDPQGSPHATNPRLLELGSPPVSLLPTGCSPHRTVEHEGWAPTERHSPGVEATSPGDAAVPRGRVRAPRVLSDEALRRQLRVLGDDPGPITELTRRVYLRRLEELTRSPTGHSPELAAALQTGHVPDCAQDELVLAQQFDRPDRSRHWCEGLLKASFNYLLLDPRVSQDLPLRCHRLSPAECFRTFVKAVFYVGKGTRARPYCHLSEALTQYRAGTKKGCPKVQRILEIWASGQGVISVHCFQNSVPAEAYTREGCLVEALGLRTITNQRKGNCYGVAASWPPERRRRLGVHMLHRAMRIFLAEGERQLRPADIQAGR